MVLLNGEEVQLENMQQISQEVVDRVILKRDALIRAYGHLEAAHEAYIKKLKAQAFQ